MNATTVFLLCALAAYANATVTKYPDPFPQCGGIAGFGCPEGYRCHLISPDWTDSMGFCYLIDTGKTTEKPVFKRCNRVEGKGCPEGYRCDRHRELCTKWTGPI